MYVRHEAVLATEPFDDRHWFPMLVIGAETVSGVQMAWNLRLKNTKSFSRLWTNTAELKNVEFDLRQAGGRTPKNCRYSGILP